MFRSIILVASALSLAAPAHAQQAPPSAVSPFESLPVLQEPGRDVIVSLLTMGNGEEVWELFGHSAFWIRDDRTGRDTVINWGVFDSHQPLFIPHFLKGLMLDQMGGDPMSRVLLAYRYYNRTVTSQELNLSSAQKDTLLSIIRVNAQPENLKYRYDYFIDNCATRPRDILNRVLGGQLRIGADSLTSHSYRWHTLRLMRSNMPLVLGVDIGLGEPADKPISRWQEMFLPRELHDWVATRQVRDSTGALQPLVRSDRVLYQSTRAPEPSEPPNLDWLWIAGVVIGGVILWLGLAATEAPARMRAAAAVVFSIWAALCGLLGVLLTLLWTITDHRFAYANENLLLFNPLWLVLAVTLPMYLLRGRAAGVTRALVRVLAICGVVALAAKVWLPQHNIPIIGLALPAALAIAFVVWRRGQSDTVIPSDLSAAKGVEESL
jgi:hypothetical protein